MKSMVAAGNYYILLRIKNSLLLIIDLVIMCNNNVIMESHYYIFLRIIDLYTKSRQKRRDRPCLSLRFRGRSIIRNNRQ